MRKIHPAQLLQTSETQSITYKVNSELKRWEKNEFEKEKDLQRERERDSNLRILMHRYRRIRDGWCCQRKNFANFRCFVSVVVKF